MFFAIAFLVDTLLIEYFICRLFFGQKTSRAIVFWLTFIPVIFGLAMTVSLIICATYKSHEFWIAVGEAYSANDIMTSWMSRFNSWDQRMFWQLILGTPFILIAHITKMWWVLITQFFCVPMAIMHGLAIQIIFNISQVVHPLWAHRALDRMGVS